MELKNMEIEAGLDIGNNTITLAIGVCNEHKEVEIIGYSKGSSNESVDKGSIVFMSKCSNAIKDVMDNITMVGSGEDLEISVGSANVALSSSAMQTEEAMGTLVLEGKEQEVNDKDLNKIIQNLKKQSIQDGKFLLHALPQEFSLDTKSNLYNPVGMQGNTIMVDSISVILPDATQRKIVQALPLLPPKKHKEPEKVAVDKFVHPALAAGLATLHPNDKKLGVVLVDIGHQMTNIAIYHGKIVRSLVTLPIGAQSITNDLMAAFGILEEQAVPLKERFGVASLVNANNDYVELSSYSNRESKEVSVKNVAIVVEERLKQLAALVWLEVKKSGYADNITVAGGLVLTGGGANIKYIDKLWSKLLGCPVKIGEPYSNLSKNQINDFTADPANAVAIGLVISGFRSYDERRTPYMEYEATERAKEASKSANESSGFLFNLVEGFRKKAKNEVKAAPSKPVDTTQTKKDKGTTGGIFSKGLTGFGDMDDKF
jgi:cell division protein FtsA